MSYAYDPTTYQSVFSESFTFLGGVIRNTHRYAERPALVDPDSGRSWTYAEFGADVAKIAGGLVARGVKPGDVVTVQLFNTPEWALLYVATQWVGAVFSPINFRLSSGETAHVLTDSEPVLYVYDAAVAEVATQALHLTKVAAKPVAPRTVVVGDDVSAAGAAEPFSALHGEAVEPYLGRTAWDESTRLYTSGTTGMPKGVSLPSVAEVMTAHDVIMHFPLTPEDRTLNMTPWFHRGGISSGGPEPVLYAGAAAVSMRQFSAAEALDRVQDDGVTFLIGAPTNLKLLADEQERNPRDLSGLRGIVTMGAPFERSAALRYQRVLTPRIFNGYGTTEAFWNTFLRPVDLPDHAGSAGRACTDDDVRIVHVYDDRRADPTDVVPRDGESQGEVIMRSLKSGYAYVNLPGQDEQRFHDGWLYTGDLATWDEHEYVTIAGRKDDMIISGGENVHPTQVEEVLAEHQAVTEALVVGLPDEHWGQLVVAYVVTNGEVTAAELDKHCVNHPMLAQYKRPRLYRFVDELPHTATGKKQHVIVRRQVQTPEEQEHLVRP